MKSLFWAGIVVFFLTFGFLGLEVLSIQMDDPFGEDPIDFDFLAQAKVRKRIVPFQAYRTYQSIDVVFKAYHIQY